MKRRVRAIICEENHYLFIHHTRQDREYWVFPGGGVEDDDADLETALIRECEEELGVRVEVGELYTKTYFEMDGEEQEQHIFFCKITSGELGTGQGPEYQPDSGYEGSYEVEWVHITEMEYRHILPEVVKDKLIEERDENHP